MLRVPEPRGAGGLQGRLQPPRAQAAGGSCAGEGGVHLHGLNLQDLQLLLLPCAVLLSVRKMWKCSTGG